MAAKPRQPGTPGRGGQRAALRAAHQHPGSGKAAEARPGEVAEVQRDVVARRAAPAARGAGAAAAACAWP
eukprot:1122957-Lingulodinium_polyedra.AAC.1